MPKVAVVTGQSRGLGLSIAAALREAGWSVPAVTRSDVDMGSATSILRFAKWLRREYREVHLLVNNAAILGPVGTLADNDWLEWEQTIRVNLLGPACLMQSIVPMMSKGGKIINVAGGGATGNLPRRSAYAASKAAMVRLTECVAAEVADRGICVNAVLPGPLPTGMRQQIVDAGESVEMTGEEALERAVRLCLYIASSEADGITGKVISARYDAWPFSNALKSDMRNGDKYTLRRVE